MSPNLRLVAYPAERHADELAIGRAGDRLAERGLSHSWRPDEAQDGGLHLIDAALHGQVFEDPLLHFLEPVVVGVEHLFRRRDVLRDLALLLPRQVDQRLEVVAHDSGFGRHRRHQPQFLELVLGFLPRVFRHASGLDPLLHLLEIGALLALAEFLLDRLYLLVQVVLALTLFHLALHAPADALLDLKDVDLRLELREQTLQPLLHVEHLEHFLLLLELERQMRRYRVGEATGLLDAGERGEDFRRNLLVELDVLVELGDERPTHRLDLGRIDRLRGHRGRERGVVRPLIRDLLDPRALAALDEHFHRAVRQLEHLENVRNAADVVHVLGRRFVLRCRLLRHEQDALPGLHRDFHRLDRLRPTDEERNHHVGKDHHVPEGKQRELGGKVGQLVGGHGITPGEGTAGRWRQGPRDSSGPRPSRGVHGVDCSSQCDPATFGWSE